MRRGCAIALAALALGACAGVPHRAPVSGPLEAAWLASGR